MCKHYRKKEKEGVKAPDVVYRLTPQGMITRFSKTLTAAEKRADSIASAENELCSSGSLKLHNSFSFRPHSAPPAALLVPVQTTTPPRRTKLVTTSPPPYVHDQQVNREEHYIPEIMQIRVAPGFVITETVLIKCNR